tara:strand:- start:13570 stop:14160 length:591 start_codon:yes stop_codon:yes gene_type:complete
MNRLIVLHLLLSLVLTIAACAPEIEPEESCNFIQNSYSRRVSWGKVELKVGIEDKFPSQYYESLERAMKVWDQERPYNMFHGRPLILSSENKDAVDIMLLWKEKWQSKPSEQAKTAVQSQGDFIQKADIFFNANKTFSVNGEGGINMKSLMIHELGHALGLDHIDFPESVMYPTLPENMERTTLSAIEKESLGCEY